MSPPQTIVININLGEVMACKCAATPPSRPASPPGNEGVAGPGGVQEIVDEAHEAAKNVADLHLGADAPVATVLRRPNGTFEYGDGCDTKADLAALVEEAKDRLDQVGTPAEGKGPAYHNGSSTNLGDVCTLAGDDQQASPYPPLNDPTLHGVMAFNASLAIYTSQNSP